MLSSCATWEQVREPVPMRWVQADVSVIRSMPGCDQTDAIACALNFERHCVVLSKTKYNDTPQWVKDHEAKHCAGYKHQ